MFTNPFSVLVTDGNELDVRAFECSFRILVRRIYFFKIFDEIREIFIPKDLI